VAFCAETEATATSAAVRNALIDMLAVVKEKRRKNSAQNATTNGTMGGTPGNQTEYAAGLVQALQAAKFETHS
jgi:folate-dependent tRNA-U54 methylase TrmFO/GidA